MIRAKHMLCAEEVIEDETRMLSVIHIFDGVACPSFPVLLEKMTVLTRLERDSGDPDPIHCEIKIRIGKLDIFNRRITNYFEGKLGAQSIITIENLRIPHAGLVQAAYLYEGSEIARHEFEINVLNQ